MDINSHALKSSMHSMIAANSCYCRMILLAALAMVGCSVAGSSADTSDSRAQPAEVAAEAVLIQLVVGGDVPKTARVRRDLPTPRPRTRCPRWPRPVAGSSRSLRGRAARERLRLKVRELLMWPDPLLSRFRGASGALGGSVNQRPPGARDHSFPEVPMAQRRHPRRHGSLACPSRSRSA
jgi:hypothetical protein